MTTVISASEPFSGISWWAMVAAAGKVCFDYAEHFRKMSLRNRYYVAGAGGKLLLTVPLVHGRNQRTPMAEVRICNKERWQVQHWRTIISAYRRAPFFEFYEEDLKVLFEKKQEWLIDFNQQSFEWLNKHTGLSIEKTITRIFHTHYDPGIADFRTISRTGPARSGSATAGGFPQYRQVFGERTGFLPGLSLLDLLFAEGPCTASWLRENQTAIQKATFGDNTFSL